jgi:hypothetical protein
MAAYCIIACMQSAEEFMLEFFRERIAEEKREQEIRAPFRRKFYSKDCHHDRRDGTLATMESERIISLSSTDTKAEVTTEQEVLPSIRGLDHFRLRYYLQSVGDRWLIHGVDPWCFECRGMPGKTACFSCGGEGWLDAKALHSKLPENDTPSPPPQSPRRKF